MGHGGGFQVRVITSTEASAKAVTPSKRTCSVLLLGPHRFGRGFLRFCAGGDLVCVDLRSVFVCSPSETQTEFSPHFLIAAVYSGEKHTRCTQRIALFLSLCAQCSVPSSPVLFCPPTHPVCILYFFVDIDAAWRGPHLWLGYSTPILLSSPKTRCAC